LLADRRPAVEGLLEFGILLPLTAWRASKIFSGTGDLEELPSVGPHAELVSFSGGVALPWS
jgi:hypothetical protein